MQEDGADSMFAHSIVDLLMDLDVFSPVVFAMVRECRLKPLDNQNWRLIAAGAVSLEYRIYPEESATCKPLHHDISHGLVFKITGIVSVASSFFNFSYKAFHFMYVTVTSNNVKIDAQLGQTIP